jgi:predicted DNA-binding protein YlxM (UPF0122 family)
MAARKGVDAESVYRLVHAGYSAANIAKQFSVSRQAIYFIIKRTPKDSVSIEQKEEGLVIVTDDYPAVATAIRSALVNAKWEVDG